jgi:hypothetical protein
MVFGATISLRRTRDDAHRAVALSSVLVIDDRPDKINMLIPILKMVSRKAVVATSGACTCGAQQGYFVTVFDFR